MRFIAFVLLLFTLVPHVLSAQQATLKGTVISADDFEPIPGVHVFIASSMIGTVTNDEGEYSLTHIPPGAVRLTFSMVGFETLIIPVFVKPGEARTLEIDLKPHAFQLDGIIVEARRDKKWQRQLKRFTRHFLGQTPNAGNTEITNPEVLDFTIEDGRFRASASEPLFIENRALGYLIHFHMKDFLEYKGAIHYQGVSFYEELVPEDVSQAAEWKSKREEAYHGSRSHLLRALFHNRLEEEQFELYEHRSPQLPQTDKLAVEDLYAFQLPTQRVREAHDLVHTSTDSLTRRLDFESVVEIVYKGELESSAFLRWQSYKYDSGEVGFQQSWMVMRELNILVDHNGSLLNPYDLMYYGYLSFEAFADELPYEYGLGAPLQ